MKDITDEIIDYLIRNRVSTTEVTDAMGKTGVMPGLYPINRGQYKAGKIKWLMMKATGLCMNRYRTLKKIISYW